MERLIDHQPFVIDFIAAAAILKYSFGLINNPAVIPGWARDLLRVKKILFPSYFLLLSFAMGNWITLFSSFAIIRWLPGQARDNNEGLIDHNHSLLIL